jgi:NAD(P)-dependent dehydrogenase (short-subunit alcohol dehydrogenase family)
VDLGIRDRVVLITGAGGGAGPTIANAFAAEGAVVALHQRRPGDGTSRAEQAAAEIEAAGGRALAVAADLRSTAEVDAMVRTVRESAGPVTILVTATSAYRHEPIAAITDASWDEVVGDMLDAAFRTCRAVSPGMIEAGWGRIVNVAARSGLVGVAGAAHYASAKAGIVGLTASLAKELGPAGVLVNAVAPTQVRTMKDGVPSIPDEQAEKMATSIPVRRLATSDDLASVVVWLGSGANSYVSGQTITLSGGAQS